VNALVYFVVKNRSEWGAQQDFHSINTTHDSARGSDITKIE